MKIFAASCAPVGKSPQFQHFPLPFVAPSGATSAAPAWLLMQGLIRRGTGRVHRYSLFVLLIPFLQAISSFAQDLSSPVYDMGTPDVRDIYVDPVHGSNSHDGSSRAQAFADINTAWDLIPRESSLARGFRINLMAGEYPESSFPAYWELRDGNYNAPIIIRGVDGPGTAVLRAFMNVYDTHYLYLLDFNIEPIPGGDAFHCEQCDHLLMRGMTLRGGDSREAHETIKINQSSHVYIENCDVSGAWDQALDFVAVQYGQLLQNRFHDATDWCAYAKGGSAYLLVEGNRFYDCGTGGFTAGQGTGLEYMTSPWLHYETYDLKIVNNVVHDTEGAAFGVNGGYNILIAFNTAYRSGSRSHALEFVHGSRSCDENAGACATRLSAGGWGTSTIGDSEAIPNRNIRVYNNVLYNPGDFRSLWSQFAIYGPQTPGAGSNIPSPAVTDQGLSIRGNIIWNGPGQCTLGVDDGSQGCQPGNPDCNAAQLEADNLINVVEPEFRDPTAGDFRPAASGNLLSYPAIDIPDFTNEGRPALPAVPEGSLLNSVTRDRSGSQRDASSARGAYASADSPSGDPTPIVSDAPPRVSRASCSPRTISRRGRISCRARASDDLALQSVRIWISNRYSRRMSLRGTEYRVSFKTPRLRSGRYSLRVRAIDSASQTGSRSAGRLRVR